MVVTQRRNTSQRAVIRQLLAGTENFRSDEPGYIVHNHPTPCPLLNESRNSVGSRFERNHIDTFRGLIGDCRTLTCLEVEPVKSTRKVEQSINVEAHHSQYRLRGAGKALKADIHFCL